MGVGDLLINQGEESPGGRWASTALPELGNGGQLLGGPVPPVPQSPDPSLQGSSITQDSCSSGECLPPSGNSGIQAAGLD